jgi:2-polyprenyl-3-methyl-5-hydroxy-6-metoxy-1,4-benzoquinol methylase
MLANRPAVAAQPVSRLPLAWEETACLLCGRDDAELRAEAADHYPASGHGLRFAVVRCRPCGLSYTNPRPTPDTIVRFYPADYRPHAPRGKRAIRQPIRQPSRFWSRILGRPCPERRGRLPWNGTGRLLDFGCGGGSYLRRMTVLGWSVAGVDVSPRVVQSVRAELGYDIHLGTLPHADLTPGSFDVVTMWQSLEHVHRPLAVLRAAFELLVPGGKLVVAVPDLDSLAATWFSEHWFGLDLPRHLTHFTRPTLTGMLCAAGFRVNSLRGLVHYHWLQSSASRAAEAGTSGLWPRLLQRKLVARAVAWGCYAVGRADCIVAVAEKPA